MDTPKNLSYAKSHEWILQENETATVGISDFAQDQLGDVVFVELPKVGRVVKQGEQVAVVESVKTASDIYSPASGEITEVNTALADEPERINAGPYTDGWMFKLKILDAPKDLLDAEAYEELAESESH